MKKAIALILALLCAFMLFGCDAEKDTDKIRVYTFSGENDVLSVTNGTIVINGDEESFSGGTLKVLREKLFYDTVYWSEEFYVLRDGEKRTVFKSAVNDMSGGATAHISGDIGKISGGNVLTEYKNFGDDDFVNNLIYKLTATDSAGREKVYEIHMNVEKVY